MIPHAFLALILPLSFIECNAKSLPKPNSLSTKLQFSMFFSPATNIVPRAWNPDKDARRKRKSYQVVAPISATYPQLSQVDTYHENVTSFVNIENSNERDKSTTNSIPTPVTGGRSTQATASSTPPSTPSIDTVEPSQVTNFPTFEDKENLDLELSELSTNTTQNSTTTEATKIVTVTTTPTTSPKTSISNGTTLSSVNSNKPSTPTVASSSSESATEVAFPLQIPTSLDLEEEREPGSSEGKDKVQPSSTESGLGPELTEISETEETTREPGGESVDGDCYTHEMMLLGQCVVMCGKELLRFCG